jgi:site-specific DNA recombinase
MKPARKTVRCAVYCRKSTEEGLDQDFNSLDAQRAAAEAYIASQQQEGWRCLAEHYDDGGYTGANLDRPALQRLLADVAAGKIDIILIYKIDRLSRSLLDFARIIETFEKHQVSFVAVTQQQLNSTTSMGRLMLNVLLSFAQFERELIAERTRDKIAAARRKGKWVGGMPLLGYQVDPTTFKLVVHEAEAEQVRTIFTLYREKQALPPVLEELARRGWRMHRWQTRKGPWRGGQAFTTTSLRRLLRNPTYLGLVRYKRELHPGEHPAIIDAALWHAVQPLLRGQRRPGVRSRQPAVLQGLLYCVPCGCLMGSSSTTRGTKQYRYYVCARAQQRGWDSCSSKSVPAGEIERVVVEQLGQLSSQEPALANFGSSWSGLAPENQVGVLQQLVERVDYDGAAGKLAITLRPDGVGALASVWNGEAKP